MKDLNIAKSLLKKTRKIIFGFDNDFLDMMPKHRWKDKLGFIKIKTVNQRGIINSEGSPTEWGENIYKY